MIAISSARAGELLVAAARGAPLPWLRPEQWSLVVEQAAGHRVVDHVHQALVQQALAQQALVQRALAQQSLVHNTLVDDGPGETPPEVLDELGRLRRSTAVGALRMGRDLDLALGALSEAGIEALTLKGPVLAQGWYDPPGLRSYGDLDLLVDPRELGAAVRVLEQLPGCQVTGSWEQARRLGAGEVDLLLPGGTPLDLHWSLLFHPAWRRRMPLATSPLLDRAIDLPVLGGTRRTLSATDTALHLALHAGLGGGQRLLWYVDLRHVLTHRLAGVHPVDWDAFVGRALAARAGLLVGHVLARGRAWFDLPVPESVVTRLRQDGPGWAHASDLLDRLRPPGRPEAATWEGRRFVRSGRGRTPTSAGVWLRDLARAGLGREQGRPGGGGADDREAFLSLVAGG